MARRGLNKVQIIGNLGRDPEMRYTSQGSAVTNFSVATGGKWTDRNGNERDDTEWFRVDAWNRLAEICNEYLRKGSHVYVEGRLRTRKYTDRDGFERTAVEIIANDVVMLDSRGDYSSSDDYGRNDDYENEESPPRERAAGAPRSGGRNQPQPVHETNEDEIPF
jgi:single-strand DNA-binding protein